MKIKLSELKQVIKEEVDKFKKKQTLEKQLNEIKGQISDLEIDVPANQEELNEWGEKFFGGLKGAVKHVGSKIEKAAGDVKKSYVAGQDKAVKEKKAKDAAEIKAKIDDLANKYKQLTGKKLTVK